MRIARLCTTFHVLPYAGGLFAQPAGFMFRLEQVLNAQDAVEQGKMNKVEAQNKLKERFK